MQVRFTPEAEQQVEAGGSSSRLGCGGRPMAGATLLEPQ
jgi:hypothetical protein